MNFNKMVLELYLSEKTNQRVEVPKVSVKYSKESINIKY